MIWRVTPVWRPPGGSISASRSISYGNIAALRSGTVRSPLPFAVVPGASGSMLGSWAVVRCARRETPEHHPTASPMFHPGSLRARRLLSSYLRPSAVVQRLRAGGLDTISRPAKRARRDLQRLCPYRCRKGVAVNRAVEYRGVTQWPNGDQTVLAPCKLRSHADTMARRLQTAGYKYVAMLRVRPKCPRQGPLR